MRVGEIGEFGLIDAFKEGCLFNPAEVVTGIGDDAAVLRHQEGMLLLAAADMLLEDIHFDLRVASPRDVGYKALAVNVSDIAAMGGLPTSALVSLGTRPDAEVEEIREIYRGLKDCAAMFGVNIVGGDTVASPERLILNVTLLGKVEPDRYLLRSGAKPGDLLAVSGDLGGPQAGLEVLRSQADCGSWSYLAIKHLRPLPRVSEARVLAQAGATAMNDISDGLASEVNEIAAASGVGAVVWEREIPLHDSLVAWAGSRRRSPFDYALYGGDDYELIFTIPQERLPQATVALAQAGSRLTVVGEIVERRQGVKLVRQEGVVELQPRGFNHFAHK